MNSLISFSVLGLGIGIPLPANYNPQVCLAGKFTQSLYF